MCNPDNEFTHVLIRLLLLRQIRRIRRRLQPNIQLRQRHLNSQLREPLDSSNMLIQRRPALRHQVRLESHPINPDLLTLQSPNHLPDRLRLGRWRLKVIVIIVQLGLGILFGSRLKSELDEFLTKNVVKHRLPVRAVLVEGFVDHVPGVALAFVVVHDVGDVGLDYRAELVLCPVC